MTTQNPINWLQIEAEYRSGIRSIRSIAVDSGVTEGAIRKKAKRDQWDRDLEARIQAKADEKVRKEVVVRVPSTQITPETEDEIIEANADLQYTVRMAHRRGLNRITGIKEKLLNQIEQAAANIADLADVIEMVRNPDEKGIDRANDALKKAMGRSALVDDLKKLAEVDEKVRRGEREAFGIESAEDPSITSKPKRVTLEFVDVEPRFD